MSRYIDADELEENMLFGMCGTGYQTLALSLIQEIPTADVVKVVRCRDCRYYNGTCEYWTSVPYGQACTKKNDFCSRGERKDGESE